MTPNPVIPPSQITINGLPLRGLQMAFFSTQEAAGVIRALAAANLNPAASIDTPGWSPDDPWYVDIEGQTFVRWTLDAPLPYVLSVPVQVPGNQWTGQQPQEVIATAYIGELMAERKPTSTKLIVNTTNPGHGAIASVEWA